MGDYDLLKTINDGTLAALAQARNQEKLREEEKKLERFMARVPAHGRRRGKQLCRKTGRGRSRVHESAKITARLPV